MEMYGNLFWKWCWANDDNFWSRAEGGKGFGSRLGALDCRDSVYVAHSLHFKRCTPFPATWLLHYVSGMGWNASTYVVDNLKKCPTQPKQNRVGRNLKLQDREYVPRNPADQCTIWYASEIFRDWSKKEKQPTIASKFFKAGQNLLQKQSEYQRKFETSLPRVRGFTSETTL